MKKYVIFILLLALVHILDAQEIEPSSQAQGYLDNKNATVDYSVGIFHYTIPLFEITSGDYSLPISLDYAGRGVRGYDIPGIVGFNWTLNAGGVVTRVARGGPDSGVNRIFSISDTSNTNLMEAINLREADAEADIFTASFNNKRVDFILKNSVAVPLEQTNVKILITGERELSWQVIDEDGCEYFFTQPEEYRNFQSEDNSFIKNRYIDSYVSSWYLSQIVVPNQDTIYFEYMDGKELFSIRDSVFNGFMMYDRQWVMYNYGESFREYPFNLMRNSHQFEEYMTQAAEILRDQAQRQYLDNFHHNIQYSMDTYTGIFIRNDLYESINDQNLRIFEYQQKVAGMLINVSKVNQASQELIDALNDMIGRFSTTYPSVSACINLAKRVVKESIRFSWEVSWKQQWLNSGYKLKSPYLKSIYTSKQKINLDYTLVSGKFPFVTRLQKLENENTSSIVKIQVDANKKLLRSVEFQGKDSRSYVKTQFNYYHEGAEIKSFDPWGYFTDTNIPGLITGNLVDSNYIKKFSLQSITNSLGGQIRFDYEPNRLGREYTGGIRVKQMIMYDGINHSDTVLYHYPLSGILVYDEFSRVEYMNYGRIVDKVTYSRMSSRGNCYVNMGNNGIYYPYVQEIMRGKGMNAYLFSVASPSCKNTWFTYPWWLSGVLLGKASYDKENRLVSVQKMKYYATTSLSPEFTGKSFFEELSGYFMFNKAEGQIRAYPGYMKNPYYNNESYLVYRDPMDPSDEEFRIDPYYYFMDRQVTLVPSSFKPFYKLFYGGKTVLKEQKEYLFPYTPVTVGPEQIEHPENVSGGQLVNKTEFYYDNAGKSTFPTRVVQTASNGDQIVTCRYTPLEFSSQASAVIQGMREKNMLAPVLKELTLSKRGGESNYRVVKDVVHEYKEYNESGKKVYLLKKELERSCDNSPSISVLPALPVSSLLSDGVYVQNTAFEYKVHGNKWLPYEIFSRTDKVSITYNNRDKELLRTPEMNQVSRDIQTGNPSLYTTYFRRLFIFAYQVDMDIKPDDYSSDFRNYLKSDYYRKIREFVLSISCMVTSPKEIIDSQSEMYKCLAFFHENFAIALQHGYIIPSFTMSDFKGTIDALTFLTTAKESEIYKFWTAVQTCTNNQELTGYPVHEYVNIDLEAKPTEKNYKVFLYARPLQVEIQVKYDITVGSNKTSASRTLAGTPGVFQLLSFDITLPTGQIDKLGVKIPEEAQAAVAVLIPRNVPFQAQAYDKNDRLLYKFDQLGNVEEYEYDMANRLIRIRDKDKNILKECQYNLIDVPYGHVVGKVYLDPATVANPRYRNKMIYYDGLGRKSQEVLVGASPVSNGDIVTPCVYGSFGKVEKEYLPYSKTSNNGAYDENAFVVSNWNIHGAAENAYAFTSTSYDDSPLDRVVKKVGSGKAWHVSGKGVSTSYGFNGTSEVRLYRVANNGNLENRGYYTAGTLQKTIVTDEDGCRAETFADNAGKIVLSVSIEGNNRLETYSVYDDRGLLRWVLSPEASSQLGTSVNETVLQRLAYRYDYDGVGRMTVKHLPGCDPVYMVYDKKDRLVMSQDGKQRAADAKKWSYSLYDDYNRVTESGEVILSVMKSHSVLLSEAFTSDNYVPSGTRTALQRSLYDTYTGTSDIPVHGFVPTSGYATDYARSVTGLITSMKTRVLETGNYLTTTTYYDDRGRVIQTVSDNLQGWKSRVDIKYDFVGNILQQRESHQVSSTRTDVYEVTNTYDDWGRLLTSSSKLNNGIPASVVYTYDAVGRLITKRLGSVTETMSYNIRGWLTGKESTPFKMKLRYELPQGGSTARYNGDISEWEWQQGTSAALMYGFTYDGVNRLKETIQKQKSGTSWGILSGSYLEKGLTYDRNGNIKTLQRTAGGNLVDNLVYTCTGNQLTGLTENVRTSPTGDIYLPGSTAASTYTYDKNGNLTNDGRKALNFTYNVLNLLSEVKTTSGTLKARYIYLADGTKLRVRDNGEVNGFDYLGSLTYRKSSAGLQLESANFGEGVIRVTGSNSGQSEVDYFLTDHLGSVRVIVDGTGKVLERNDYYPFGARHVRSDYLQLASNRFQYNGKEEQETGNLACLDYGVRMYDSGLGRWYWPDPLQEKYYSWSTYQYCGNNPINRIDIDGMDWFIFDGRTGSYENKRKAGGVHRMVIKSEDKKGNIRFQFYDFNDPEVDALAILNGKINRIDFLSDENVNMLIEESGVLNSSAQFWRWSYAAFSCVGKMDYGLRGKDKGVFEKNTFYIRENVAYNIGDIGNYMWGRGMAELGFELGDAQIAAHVHNAMFGRARFTDVYDFGKGTSEGYSFLDSPADQRAIRNGYNSTEAAQRVQEKIQRRNKKINERWIYDHKTSFSIY